MNALSLFSGIGGIDLACEWAGIKTVAMCEREPFCQKVLRKHWPDVPIYDDVCTLTKERLNADGIGTIDLIHGGYPCQPFSIAGKREGERDDRHLWPEVKRLLETIRPRWFVGENVAGHITLGLDEVLSDLDDIGYTAQPFVIPACAVGAIHRRDRVFITAHAGSNGCSVTQNEKQPAERREQALSNIGAIFEYAPHTNEQYVEGHGKPTLQGQQKVQGIIYPGSIEEWAERSAVYQPKLSRDFNGVSYGVDRIKSLGNAVVPQQIYPILAAMKQIDDLINAA